MEKDLCKLDFLSSTIRKKKLKLQTQLYRSKHGITLTSTFAKELVKSLQRFSKFIDQEMNDSNILQQYEFLWIIKMINKVTISLEKLKIKLEDLVSNEKARIILSQLIQQITTELAEKGLDRVKINTEENQQELNSIWDSIITESKAITQRIANLISQPKDQMLDNIIKITEDIRHCKVDSSGIMFMKFLSSSEILKNPSEYPQLEGLFEASCDLIAQKYKIEIQGLTFQDFYQDIELIDSEKA